MNNRIAKRGVATNSIILAFVQCLTMITGILQAMILSRKLTETEYGTYSQGMLIANFLIPFLLLGLANAVTYFTGKKDIDKIQYVDTIITLVFILGLAGTAGILLFRNAIVSYFNNPQLMYILPMVSVLPLLLNVITVYQTLFIAENMASSVAIRNATVAVLQVLVVAVGVILLHDIRSIFVMIVLMDILQIFVFVKLFEYRKYKVKLHIIKKNIACEIFRYSLPLAFSVAIGTLSIYMDKLLIGRMMSVEDFALYTNMAKELPISFIVSSFTTVIMPAFVKMHSESRDDDIKRYWKSYLELGLSVTWILCGAAIFCSKDLLIFLYSEKYARGIGVFVVYLTVELCRFSYFGIILSTFGRTKLIMYSSCLSLLCNFILNIVFFHLFGIVGPAVASLLTIFMMELLQLFFSCKLLGCKIGDIFDFKVVFILVLEITAVGASILYISSKYLNNVNNIIRLMCTGFVFILILGLLNMTRIKKLITEINSI